MLLEARRVIVRGRVQGVGFRWFVVRNARALGVRGTVRNRPDGTVEAILQAQGVGLVETLIDRIRAGPTGARVERVDVEPTDELAGNLDEMQVIR
ncbi:MAG: acylphosphatase [Gemmatimonadota bacterium]